MRYLTFGSHIRRGAVAAGLAAVLLIGPASAGWKDKLEAAASQVIGGGSEESEEDGEDSWSVGAAAIQGGVVCGGVAAVLGEGASTVAKAGAICGAANAAYTALANSGKQKYAEQYKEIAEDMAESEERIAELQARTEANQRQTSSYEKKTRQLIEQEKDDKALVAKAGQLRLDMDAEIRALKKSQSDAKTKIAILDDQISQMDAIIQDSPEVEDLKKTRVALIDQRQRLNELVKQSNGLEQTLVAQQQKLEAQIIERS